jgi:hypothetical protein
MERRLGSENGNGKDQVTKFPSKPELQDMMISTDPLERLRGIVIAFRMALLDLNSTKPGIDKSRGMLIDIIAELPESRDEQKLATILDGLDSDSLREMLRWKVETHAATGVLWNREEITGFSDLREKDSDLLIGIATGLHSDMNSVWPSFSREWLTQKDQLNDERASGCTKRDSLICARNPGVEALLEQVVSIVGGRSIEDIKKLVKATCSGSDNFQPAAQLLATKIDELIKARDAEGLSLIIMHLDIPEEEKEKLRKAGFVINGSESFSSMLKHHKVCMIGHHDDGIDRTNEPMAATEVSRMRSLFPKCPTLEKMIQAVDALLEIDKKALGDLLETGKEEWFTFHHSPGKEAKVSNIPVRRYIITKLGATTPEQQEREQQANEILDAIPE